MTRSLTVINSFSLLVVSLLAHTNAAAQFNTSITDSIYHQPWVLHTEIFNDLSNTQLALLREEPGGELSRSLIYLETDAKYFESKVLEAINQLFGLPGFSKIAGDISQSWSEPLTRVNQNLDIVYRHLGLQNDPQVIEARATTQTLINILAKQRAFEKDVYNSLGRGLKPLVVDMANRWWLCSEGLTGLIVKITGRPTKSD